MMDKKKIEELEARGYRVNIIGRNIDITAAMKNYALDRIAKMDKLQKHVLDVQVTLDIQKHVCSVVILAILDHVIIKVHKTTRDMYECIDLAMAKLQKKLTTWKRQIEEHNAKKLSEISFDVSIVESPTFYDEEEEIEKINEQIAPNGLTPEDRELLPHKVLGKEFLKTKILTEQEAVMKMELSDDSFLIYRDEIDQNLKVIYRRPDKNYGIIQMQ